jgi:hypothetical protein
MIILESSMNVQKTVGENHSIQRTFYFATDIYDVMWRKAGETLKIM